MNDIVLNKKASIERCVAQVRDYYARDTGVPFEVDYFRQDAIAMNLQRLCELSIDLANHWVRVRRLGLPKDSADAFALLARAGLIEPELAASLRGMVGFRNTLVHAYTELDLAVLVRVIEERLGEPLAFADAALAGVGEG